MKTNFPKPYFVQFATVLTFLVSSFAVSGQSNVFDDIIATSPNHNYLEAALIQENLDDVLRNNAADYTVFAPDDNAFASLATALGTDINGLLALPNLADILTYHVLGTEIASSGITNGAIVQPLSASNTLKLTITSGGNVFVNQAQVSAADIQADNGIVHVLNGVVLPVKTVVDIALENGFSSLAAAVIKAELMPALTDPLSNLTVFAPTNAAFDTLASALGTDINGLLALPNLADVLTYHVLGTELVSTDITNGSIVQPLSASNTLKLTLTSGGNVFVNQAQVTSADIQADNGVVHVLNEVVLPVKTVVDRALENGFSSLAAAVVKAELMPALTDPLSTLTVFAPTNAAFDTLASVLGTDINGLLALPNLADVLTYHVLGTEVESTDITNGSIVQPLSASNTLKLTLTSGGNVFVNQAQVTAADIEADNGIVHVLNEVVLPVKTVVDRALENGFSSLATAVVNSELMPALTNPFSTLTVFAPTNEAFDNLASALGTDINGLLSDPDLAEVLIYHVLGTEVESTDITNGAIVQPLSNANTLKLTLTSGGNVFVNQAQVTAADIEADNGVVHVLDAVLLPSETVVDVALDNGFTSLAAAVVKAELIPALTNPLSTLTVFAPTNEAFDNLSTALGTDINGLLELPNLADVLTYHVLGTYVASSDITNGAIVQPLSATNNLKLTLTSGGDVFVNQAKVSAADIEADNGIVHVLDGVVLPVETLVDLAIDNGFTSLASAVVKAELLPALTNPFANLTVFAPTNEAFDNLASTLGTDINGILALPNLEDILTYHVLGTKLLAAQLTTGPVSALNGKTLNIDTSAGVKVNNSNVILADAEAFNGVAHVIDAVLLPAPSRTDETLVEDIVVYPNPTTEVIRFNNLPVSEYQIMNAVGNVVKTGQTVGGEINVAELSSGAYFINFKNTEAALKASFIKK